MNCKILDCRGALPGFTLLVSVLALGGALLSQYGFGLRPCHLCLLQRYPHAVIIALSLVALVMKDRRWLVHIGLICGFLLVVDSGIATYHAAVEKGLVSGPSSCTVASNAAGETSLDDLRKQLETAPTTFCDEPAFEWHGFTMASLHALYCAWAALLLFWWLKKSETA